METFLAVCADFGLLVISALTGFLLGEVRNRRAAADARTTSTHAPASTPVVVPIGNTQDPAFARVGNPATRFEAARFEAQVRALYSCRVCSEPSVIACPQCSRIVCVAHLEGSAHRCSSVMGAGNTEAGS